VLVLLPPSETKRAGGNGPPLSLAALSFPELDPLRKELVDELVGLAANVPASRAALGLSVRQDGEVVRNAALWTSPTLPARHRYTGVLYDALDVGSLRGVAAGRAQQRVVVASALFGLLRATDPVPAYRLSATSVLPGRPTLPARWRPLLDPLLAALGADETVVDLRSGTYATLGRAPVAVTVNVLAERPDGRRVVVSHANKSVKGRVARALAVTRAEPSDAAAVAAVVRRAGMRVERTGPTHLDVVVPGWHLPNPSGARRQRRAGPRSARYAPPETAAAITDCVARVGRARCAASSRSTGGEGRRCDMSTAVRDVARTRPPTPPA
jgi:cytoplasmic iron level regulating protein YaaA (DUF328/UPF0246 family)